MTVAQPTAGTEDLQQRTFGPLTLEDVVRYQGASGDLNPHHYDARVAAEAGFERFFSPGMLQAGLLGSMVADAFGAESVRRFRVRFHELVWVGDTITLSMRVTKRYSEDAERRADIELTCVVPDGTVAVTGVATVLVH